MRRLLAAVAILSALALSATAVDAASPGWTTFMGSNARTDFNGAEAVITPASAHRLKLAWTRHVKATGSPAAANVYTQPIVSSKLGLVFWGSFNGYEYASRTSDGAIVWKVNLGQTIEPNCNPTTVGVVSTATLATGLTIGGYTGPVLFLAGGNAKVYALAARTVGNVAGGSILWSYSAGSPPDTFLWSSPAYYNGDVYIGVASDCDNPLIQGKLLQLHATTGALHHELDVAPNGCIGNSVWSSPAIDTEGIGNSGNPTMYFTTGNPGACGSAEPYGEAMVEVSAADVSQVLGYWSVPENQRQSDSDFGGTPTIQNFTVGATTYHRVGAMNKNGIYYEFDRGSFSAPVWETQVSTGTRNVTSSAFDGSNLYADAGSTTVSSVSCDGTVNSIDPLTGSFNWRTCVGGNPLGEVMAVPGVVALTVGNSIRLLSASNGSSLFKWKDSSMLWGTPTIFGGRLYFGDNAGNLRAFRIPN